MRRQVGIALALGVAACGFGRGVGQSGAYENVPSTHVTDTAVYPLQSLLIIEHDQRVQQARIYVFRGNLRAADVGLEDLRRVALRFGAFVMAFDAPQGRVAVSDELDAGVEDADAGPIVGHAEPLSARVGDQAVTLVRLDDKTLFRSGASRYLTGVRTTEYEVAAYFGVVPAPDVWPEVTIDKLGIAFAGAPGTAQPELVRTPTLIGLSYTTTADYLVVELVQSQRRKLDGSRVDALVRTALAPGVAYALSPRLLTDVAGQGCWSRERPVEARVRQIARSYQQQPRGDWAVSYERIEVVPIATDDWTALLGELRAPAYCSDLD
jgi:hypothetical protein